MKVAVTGASGLLGSALVPALETDGHEVVTLVRREPRAPNEIEWDPEGGKLDVDSLAGVEAAVNLSGATIGRRWTKARKAEIVASRVDSTRLLSETLAQLEPRPKVLVSAGGVGIYGDRADEVLTEESKLGDDGFLPEVGKAWEAASGPRGRPASASSTSGRGSSSPAAAASSIVSSLRSGSASAARWAAGGSGGAG